METNAGLLTFYFSNKTTIATASITVAYNYHFEKVRSVNNFKVNKFSFVKKNPPHFTAHIFSDFTVDWQTQGCR